MPDFAVSTAFNATGNILKSMSKMINKIDRFGDSSTKAFRKASRSGSQFGNIVKGILVTDVIKGGLRALTNGLRAAGSEFINYDQAITSASAKFKDLNTETIKGKKTLQSLMDTARELGATTEFSATQAAQGLDFLATAGFATAQAITVLPGVVDLATVATLNLARSTDIVSDSIGAFGLATENTDQLLANSTRINNVFAKSLTNANLNMESLFESVIKGAPAFTAAGQSIETFSTLTSIMANSGVKGAEAGTSLRNIMLRLADPAADATKIMKKLGIQTQNAEGDFRDVIDILADFEKGLGGMGTAQRTAALSTVFGARSVTGVNLLLQEGTESLRNYRKGLIDSAGASKRMADIMRGSINNQLASLKSAAFELGFQFIDTFKDKIGPAIQALTETIRGIDVAAIVENFKSLIDVGMRFRGVLFGLVAGWVAFKVAMGAAAMFKAIQGFIMFARALRAAALAQGILNTVMMLNPIGLIIAGVAALIAGFFLLVDNFDVVKDLFVAGLKFMFAPLFLAIEAAKKLGSFIGGFFGGDEEAKASARTAPNAPQLAAQEVRVNGQINLAGAPEGSTFESDSSSAPEINMGIAGLNP